MLTSKIKEFLTGHSAFASRAEYKRVMLTGYLSIIEITVAVVYSVLDILNGVYYSAPGYAVLFLFGLLSIYFVKRGNYRAGKISVMASGILVVFWAALTDPFETGVFMFFIPAGIGSFAVLGFEEYKTGIALALLATLFFLLAYFVDIPIVTMPKPSEGYIRASFVLNYCISMTVSILVVYFLMNLNRLSEDELIQKEKFASQKNEELEKVNIELDRFVYSVSHDLRSPLSSILGLINIAQLTVDERELKEILAMIRGRVNAQDDFIREIIDYSRNARTETAIESFSLAPLVTEIIESLRYNTNANLIEFRTAFDEKLVLHTDRTRLKVILSNLTGNAIKYHDFTKQKPIIEIGFHAATGDLYVMDNGSGMKPEHKEKIFHMFYRGSDRSSGSGLGLFIAREAAQKINSRITVTTELGAGSTFTVHLPPSSIAASDARS